jgi:AraC family transcriptional regulator, transcriptional activator of pobA
MMDGTAIPTHDKPSKEESSLWIERIVPTEQPVINSVHRHTYHELFLFKKGSGVHMIDLEPIPFEAPCIHFVAPGQVHKLDRSADTDGYVVMFHPELGRGIFSNPRIRSLLRAGAASRSMILDKPCLGEAMNVIAIIEQEHRDQGMGCASVLESLLAVLLLKCVRWSDRSNDTGREEKPATLVERFLDMVDQEFLEKKQVNAYAADLSVSPGHLNELVKKNIGRNASEVLHERLMLEAKRLLLHSDLSVKEVCFALKMEDPAYFTRMFKRDTGLTPGEYREHIREKYQH